MSKKTPLALVVALLPFAVYANSLGNGFVWDDPVILTRQLPVFRASSVLLPPPNIPQFAPDYYRPLVIASYLVDQDLGRGNPWWFHLSVVVAHASASVGVFLLGLTLFGRLAGWTDSEATLAAGLGAALFAVHPVHVEAVAWMAGRADVLATLFGVAAVCAHLQSRRRPAFALAAGASLLLALLSKEVAVSIVLLLPLLDWLAPEPAAPESASRGTRKPAPPPVALTSPMTRYGPIAAAVLVYAGLRLAAVSSNLRVSSGEADVGLPLRLVAALGVYVEKMLLPFSLNAYIAELPTGLLALLAGVVEMVGLGFLILREWRAGRGATAFLLAWFVVTLAPSLSILIKIPEVPVAERYLYLPSVGLCLAAGCAAACGIGRAGAVRTASMAVSAAVLVVFVAATVGRNPVWASDALLWADTVAKNPNAGMPLQSLGDSLVRANRAHEAERAYLESLARRNSPHGRAATYSNLGMLALNRGETERAEEYYRQSLLVHPLPEARYSLGVIGLRQAEAAAAAGDEAAKVQRARAALAELEQAERASPLDANLQLALGHALSLVGRPAESRPHFQRALSLGLAPEVAKQVQVVLAQN